MRMRLLRASREEDGGILAIVVVCLVVMLGMVALTVDFGSSYVKRRSMVNSADSAALAFAVWCATGQASASADAQADATAASNTTGAVRTTGSPSSWPVTGTCSPGSTSNAGSVSVSYQGQANQYFAPIVGRSSTQRVVAKATAAWGAAGAAGNVLPLMVNKGKLTNCHIPVTPGTECFFYVDNNALGNATWALMNVDPTCSDGKYGWNVSTAACPGKVGAGPTYKCPTFSNSDLQQIVNQGSPALTLNAPNPTYVCTVPGNHASVFDNMDSLQGNTRLFPVNDETRQIKSGGAICLGPACTPDMFDIVGFSQMKILNVWKGTGGSGWDVANCPGPKKGGAYCLHTIYQGFTTSGTGGICGGCQNFGVEAVELQG